MEGCPVCKAEGHRPHDSHLPEAVLCPNAIALKRSRTRRAQHRYRNTAKGMVTEARREAKRRGTRCAD